MNREEALLREGDMTSGYQIFDSEYYIKTINEIYDEFENRTCDNCKSYDDCQIIDILHDENADIEDDNFSCSRWESIE